MMELLSAPTLSPRAITEIRRLVAQLHALSAVVTRTRKVEIEEHKAVRASRHDRRPLDTRRIRVLPSLRKVAIRQGPQTRSARRVRDADATSARRIMPSDGTGPSSSTRPLVLSTRTWTTMTTPTRPIPMFRPPNSSNTLGRLGDIDTKFDELLPQLRADRLARQADTSLHLLPGHLGVLATPPRFPYAAGGAPRWRRPVMNVIASCGSFERGGFDIVLASRVRQRGTRLRVLLSHRELRPSMEPDGSGAAHRSNRSVRSDGGEGPHPQPRHAREPSRPTSSPGSWTESAYSRTRSATSNRSSNRSFRPFVKRCSTSASHRNSAFGRWTRLSPPWRSNNGRGTRLILRRPSCRQPTTPRQPTLLMLKPC